MLGSYEEGTNLLQNGSSSALLDEQKYGQ